MNIVLFQPQIPQNTGNIVRTCKATNANLFLIPPFGFKTTDKELRRAGLDYWLGVHVEQQTEEYILSQPQKKLHFFSSKQGTPFWDTEYNEGDFLIFGSETDGLPKKIHQEYADCFRTIPMFSEARCLNLSNAVAIAIYEAKRQQAQKKDSTSAFHSVPQNI